MNTHLYGATAAGIQSHGAQRASKKTSTNIMGRRMKEKGTEAIAAAATTAAT